MKRMVEDIIDLVKDNKNILMNLNKEDNEIFAFDFNINKLIEVFSKYKNELKKEATKQKILVSHYGNPYITAMLCMEAILYQTDLVIGIEEVCYGVNKGIVKIVKDVLKTYKLPIQISLKRNVVEGEIEEMNLHKIICLGNSNAYTNFRKIKSLPIQYIPLFDSVIYYDSNKYEELVDTIRCYAIQNLYEIEIFDETEDFEEVIEEINNSLPRYCAVLLSMNKEKQEKFKREIKMENIYINQNPFQQFELKIPSSIFE